MYSCTTKPAIQCQVHNLFTNCLHRVMQATLEWVCSQSVHSQGLVDLVMQKTVLWSLLMARPSLGSGDQSPKVTVWERFIITRFILNLCQIQGWFIVRGRIPKFHKWWVSLCQTPYKIQVGFHPGQIWVSQMNGSYQKHVGFEPRHSPWLLCWTSSI